jgi:hypothetical protein
VGGRKRKRKKKKEKKKQQRHRSPAVHHANWQAWDGTGRAREPGPPTNAVDPIIAIAAVGAATWTYQQPVATMRGYLKLLYSFALN